MNFVSFRQFYADIAVWERELPHFDAVCGIPRSGMIPAAYIAMRRNIRLVELADLLREPEGAISRSVIRKTNPIVRYKRKFGNRLLIVDDSSSDQSVTISGLREQLAGQTTLDISYAAAYRASANSKVDYFFREVPQLRMFEWNWFRHWRLPTALLDMDGVLCEDWKGPPEKDDDPAFREHLRNVRPLYLPDVPIRSVVTSRLERYRAETANWLERYGVQYKHLVMHPAKTPEARRAAGDHAKRKAQAYMQKSDASLFVESDIRQARIIHEHSKRPVLCTDTMELLS